MKDRKSMKILAELQEKTFEIAHNSNNFLDTKAFNLLTVVGLILTIWLFSINFMINNRTESLKNIISLCSNLSITYKDAILYLSSLAIIFYIVGVFHILYVFIGRGFDRIWLTEENIEKYGKMKEPEVYEMVVTILSSNITKLRRINEIKSNHVNKAIRFIILGIIITIIALILTIWVI